MSARLAGVAVQRVRRYSVAKVDDMGQAIRAVSLDVGGTLIGPYPSVGHVYAEIAKSHGVGDFPPDTLTKQFFAGWKEKGFFDYSLDNWRDLVKCSFAGLAPVSDELFHAIYSAFADAKYWEVYKDVVPALQELKARKVKLAAVSNWDTRLRPLLQSLKLAEFFDVMIVSAEIGAHKPDPQIFKAAADALQLPAEHILHVGDSEREDYEGARNAGMMSLLLNRGSASDKGVETITDLKAVLRILDKPV